MRHRLDVEESAKRLNNFFKASVELTKVMARTCGHPHLNPFNAGDLTTWKKDMAERSGIAFGGLAGDGAPMAAAKPDLSRVKQ